MIFILLFPLTNYGTLISAGDSESQVSSLMIEDVRIGATKEEIKKIEKSSELVEKKDYMQVYQRPSGDVVTYFICYDVDYKTLKIKYKYADRIYIEKKAADLKSLYDEKLGYFKELFGEPTAEIPARTYWYPENIEFCLFYNGEKLMYEIKEYKLDEFDRKQIAQCIASPGYKVELTKNYHYLNPIVSYQSYEELKSNLEAILKLNMEEIKPNSFKGLPRGGQIVVKIIWTEYKNAKSNNFTLMVERDKKILHRQMGASSPSRSGDYWVGKEIVELKEPIGDYINFYVIDNQYLIRTKFVIRKMN
jgi:hypothetical protein